VVELDDERVTFEPRDGRRPWGVVHFVGGAALGSFPAAAYGYLLSSLADVAGVGCVATPYDVDLDHNGLAAAVSSKFDVALERLRAERAWPDGGDDRVVFGLGHSLGAKLLLLSDDSRYARVVSLAGNNFGLADSAKLVKAFLDTVSPPTAPTPASSLLDFAAMAASMTGLEVRPTPAETLDRIRASSTHVTFVAFDDDNLDSTDQLRQALASEEEDEEDDESAIRLPGGYLSCVYIAPFNVGDPAVVQDVARAIAKALQLPGNVRRRQRRLLWTGGTDRRGRKSL